MTQKIKICCRTCQSENVVRDAWAEWDIEKQDWVLQNVFDDAFCEDCESSTKLERIPLEPEEQVSSG